jgi:hypothetical protein
VSTPPTCRRVFPRWHRQTWRRDTDSATDRAAPLRDQLRGGSVSRVFHPAFRASGYGLIIVNALGTLGGLGWGWT